MTELTEKLRAELKATAHAMADAARPVTLRYFRQTGLTADNKETDRFDPVTAADRGAEESMRAILAEMRPDDAILGEEFGAKSGTTGLTWVLDPIDGTRGYISGTPTWGVLIAVNAGAAPVFGIIDQPYIGERFSGGFGQAELRGPNGTVPLATRPCAALSGATLFSTYPEVGNAAEAQGFGALSEQVKLVRFGIDCYAYALLAAGQIDLVVEAGLQAYDVQGPIAVVEAAGGIVTNWQGGPAHDGGRILAAGSPEVHALALQVLRGVPA